MAAMNAMGGFRWWFVWLGLGGTLGGTLGCSSPLIRMQSPESEAGAPVIDVLDEEYELVGDITSPRGMNFAKVEAIAMVSGLDDTGSDPPPSSKRQMLIDEMQTHDVKNPSRVLASTSTSMAIAYGYLRPGIRKGERFDVLVRAPSRSETTSLGGGFLMQSRMREMAVLANTIHTGLPIALARGDVLLDALFDEDDGAERRGRVLGGGVVLKDRPLGLSVRDGFNSVMTSSMIGAAINRRFHTFDRGFKRGVATPKRDNFVELIVHPRYKHNISRYVRVLRAIPLKRDELALAERLRMLAGKLLEPTTTARAAIELEAIGGDAVEVLNQGLASPDALVRFCSAETLAYLDQSHAAAPLAGAAREEIAFRWRALTALAAMEHVDAYDALIGLLDVSSAETRYGAFFALHTRNPYDPLVRGEWLGDQAFSFHVMSSDAEPMIHFARYRRPEVVIFGGNVEFEPPAYLFAGTEILLKRADDGGIKVSRFRAGEDDQHVACRPRLDDVIRTVLDMGAGYADVLDMVHKAQAEGYLDARVEVNAMPKPRGYQRDDTEDASSDPAEIPELFWNQESDGDASHDDLREELVYPENGERDRSRGGFFGKMTSWLAP